MNEEERIKALEQRVKELESRLRAERLSPIGAELVRANSEIMLKEIDKLVSKIDFTDEPQFFISSSPIEATAIPTLFESSAAPVVKIFENPREVRDNGFVQYKSQSPSTIVEGTTRELLFRSQGRRVNRGGEFAALFHGGDDFLCWAMRGPGWPLKPSELEGPGTINSLVLIEATHNCVTLIKDILQYAQPQPSTVQFAIGYRNMARDGVPPKLLNGKADRQMLGRPRANGTRGDCFFSVVAPFEESAERVSFRLVAEIYHTFNLVDDVIPYATVLDGYRIIDPQQL